MPVRQIYKQFAFVVTSMLLMSSFVYAQSTGQQSTSTNQVSTVQTTQTNEIKSKAQEWGLQAEEWQRYLELMDGQLGIYSPGLDPLTTLGISARNEEERRYYAEKQVMAEMRRVERELAYQRAYDDAFKRMFPNLLPLDLGGEARAASVMPANNNRQAVFISDHCVPCNLLVQKLQTTNVAFDIYMIDSNNDDTIIRRWATRAGIDPQKVISRVITLNHDAGRWQSLGVKGGVPAVLVEVNGKWQRQ